METPLRQRAFVSFWRRTGQIAIVLQLIGPSATFAAPFAYITNMNLDRVTVVDTATRQVTTIIDVGNQPTALAIRPDGRFVYVLTHTPDNYLAVLDATTNTVVSRITLTGNPYVIAIRPGSDRAYIYGDSSWMHVFSMTTNSMVRVFQDTSNLPNTYAMAFAPNGQALYLSVLYGERYTAVNEIEMTGIWGLSRLMIIDASQHAPQPGPLAVTTDGAQLFVSVPNGPYVSVIDTATNAIVGNVHFAKPLTCNPETIVMAPNGTRAYVSCFDRTVAIDVPSRTEVASVPLPILANFSAFTPDGSELYVTSEGGCPPLYDPCSKPVSILDTATNTVVDTVSVEDPTYIAIQQVVVATATSTPTAPPTSTATTTATGTISATPTVTVVSTATVTPTATAMPAPTSTATASDAGTPTPTPTGTPGCGLVPEDGCRLPIAPGKAALLLKDNPDDAKDALAWTWSKGAVTAKAEFGDPTTATAYDLCIYDATPALILSASVPPGGLCGTLNVKPCWKMTRSGFGYSNRAGAPYGVQKLTLVEGLVAGRARIVADGKGVNLDMPAMPIGAPAGLPVTVQLKNTAGVCWEATYSAPIKNDAVQFRARSD